MLTPQFAVMPPISSSMPRFRMLIAIIHNYAGRSDSLGIIALPAKRSLSSIFEAASLSRSIPCRSALNRYFELCPFAG
jgi:hypothetical protein